MRLKQIIEELYWDPKGVKTVMAVASQLNYSRSGLENIMNKEGIPTAYALITNFHYWRKILGDERVKAYFGSYLQTRSLLAEQYRTWIDITSKNKESLESIRDFLKEFGIDARLGNYNSKHSFYLRIQNEGINKLCEVFNLSW